MSKQSKRIADLSPEKRALLMLRLKNKKSASKAHSIIPPRENREIYPLSFAQERMWFLDQFTPGSPLYNISAAVRLSGTLDIPALQQSVNEILKRHEVLRACFITENGNPVQVIAPELRLELPIHDLSELPETEREIEAKQRAVRESQRIFNLAEAPLIHVSLLRLDDRETVLLLTVHHSIADGWSIGIIIQEIAILYRAFTAGAASPLPPLPIQYADFAHWQRNWLQSDVLEKQLAFWKKQLADSRTILELPTDHPRPAMQSFKGLRHSFELTPQLAETLRELSRREGTTLFMTLLAAFQTLLFRYTGQDDINVGSPIANRTRPEIEGIVGFFINTLVMRTSLAGDPSFRELLARVKEVALSAFANQDIPFEKLVEGIQPERDMSHTPLFQVVFDLQTSLLDSFEMGDLKFQVLETENETAKFDLMLQMEDSKESLRGIYEYNTDLFDTATIERMSEHFQLLLENIVANPAQSISRLNLISSAEKYKILTEWTATTTGYPRDKSVSQLFEAQVEQTPEAIALIFEEQTVTYRELNARANRLAHYLKFLGIGQEMPVGIYMERSLEMIVATLGILKAGGAYLPLDPNYPEERLSFMLEEGQVSVLLTLQRMKDKLPQNQTKIVCLDSIETILAQESQNNPVNRVTADHLAYVMYTSGSTGRPKGVSVVHRGIVRLVKETNYADFTTKDVFLQLAPVSFDAATLEIWGPLLNGGQLVVFPAGSPSLAEIGKTLIKYKVTTLWLTASLFHLMVDERLDDLKGLRQLLAGGDVLSTAHVRKVLDKLPNCQFINGYGPHESTTFTCCERVSASDWLSGAVPIGRPISNTTVYILDKNCLPVPIGVPGELYIGGEGLARDYLKRPELTADKYVPHPFSKKPGERLYKTGDLVRYLPSGKIEFLGRIDFQVKIRGFRIEPGEIEAVISQHQTTRDVVVLVREDTPGDKQLAAYIIAEQGSSVNIEELRSFTREKLPDYMVPTAFVLMDSFPVTPNGKVDRRRLPVPESSAAESEKTYVPPRSDFEQALVKMWQEILRVKKIGIYDNFFEIGGNSLQAAVFINRIQKEYDQEAHVQSIFLAPTIAEFSMYVSEYYPDLIAKYFSDSTAGSHSKARLGEVTTGTKKIDTSTIDQFKQIIVPLAPRTEMVTPKNPPAIFVLSPPRSGSTLFRVMLAGHSGLFAPPELDILSFNSMEERKNAFSDDYSIWLEATWRAIMEVKNCAASEARKIMEECEKQKLSAKEFYRLLQDWIKEKILVDKTPSYPMDIGILKRAETDFDNALFIHLTRHPYATVYSFLEAKLDKNFFRYEHPFSRRELAELIWLASHQNILEFLKDIPTERQFQLSFESLVSQPEPVMHQLCDFLKLDFQPEMLKPYQGKRMTDGIKASSQMVGDFKFYLHKNIDNNAAERWRKVHTENFLSAPSWEVAEKLGYEQTEDLRDTIKSNARERKVLLPLEPVPRDGDLVLSYQQQRLWFLDQMEPGSSAYNVPMAIQIDGNLDLKVVRLTINEIIRRHEALRTQFTSVEGKARIQIISELQLEIKAHDLSQIGEAEKETLTRQQVLTEALVPYDLANEPLVRTSVFRLGENSHIVLVTMHHIISDGWSAGVIMKEFAALYEAYVAGNSSPLPDLKIQYVDYARWQRTWLNEEVIQAQLDYWTEQLAGSPPLLELPTDRPRPAEVTYNGSNVRINLSPELTAQIKALSRDAGATEFMTLLTAFQILLYRYTGETRVNVGTPIANRQRAEIEPLVGFFVNTLVLPTDLSGNPSFKTLLNRVRDVSLGAYAHQDLPFEMLVDKIHPERNMSHAPIFQVMFAFQNTPNQDLQIADLRLRPFPLPSKTSKFDLTLSIREFRGEYRGQFEYNTDLFNADTIERMVSHFQTLLDAIVAAPETKIAELPLLSQPEEQKLLVDWNQTSTGYPADVCLHQLFEEQAARSQATAAVVYGEEQLSFAELNLRANQLAHYLRKLGVGPDVLVGIYVERSIELLTGIWGILKAGGAYVPLDPSYPKERLQYILEDSNVPVLLTLERLGLESVAENKKIVNLDADWETISSESTENPVNLTAPENLAYLIYTSGSTGKPKGTMLQHRSALNLWAALNRNIYANHPQAPLKVSLNAPMLFDASVQQLVMLLSGHTLDIVPQAARLDGDALLKYIRMHQLDVLDCVPSQLKLLLDAGLLDGTGPAPAAILPGGEAIDEATWQTLQNARDVEFYNMYGPTECTVDSTICRVKTASSRPVIGRPVNNARFYVLDEKMNPVPLGVPGELFIGGHGLARGYLHRPALSAEKFVPDPFSGESGERLYRTGDLVRYLADGNIEFLGRIDHQVKLRGFRIELGEIEANLKQYPGLSEVVVIVREDIPGTGRLVGYVVPAAEEVPSNSELRNFLQDKLPDYMIPSLFVTLEKMPLTPNGKIDRKALPAPDQQRPQLDDEFVEPRNEIEEKLAALVQQILNIEKVGVFDNFFELGGDSILSIQVIARAKQQGIQLTPKQLFQHPTVAGLAEVAGTAPVIQAEQGTVTGEVAVTPIQQAFFEQNFKEPQHWNQSILLEVQHELDLAALKQVIHGLLNHHDALRFRYRQTETGWLQWHAEPDASVPFEVIDLAGIPPAELSEKIEAEANRIQRSLNLTDGPILRFAWFQTGLRESNRLLIVIHHLAIDGVSWRILMEDLLTGYQRLSRGEPLQLPAKTTAFRQWSEKLTEYAQTTEVIKEGAYWGAPADLEMAPLPTDFTAAANTEADAKTVTVALTTAETQALLQEVPPVYGTEMNDVLLTALMNAYFQWTNRRTLFVDLEGHGREPIFEDVDISRTVGWFTSLYPVALKLENEYAAGEALISIKEQLRHIPSRGIHFGILRYLTEAPEISEQLKAVPKPQVCFNYLGQFDQNRSEHNPFVPAAESSGLERSLTANREHLHTITGSISGGRLKVSWMYPGKMYRAATIENLAQHFLDALRNLIVHCQNPESGGYTPSDFQDVDLNQGELDEIMDELDVL